MTDNKPRGPKPSAPARIDWDVALAEHDRWLRTVIYVRLRDWSAVDEVFQEVALAAVRQSAPIHDTSKVAPWLYRLAVRQSLLFRRRMGRQRKLLHRYIERRPSNDFDDHTPDPLGWLMLNERRQMIREALSRLRDGDAEILMLKYTEHWSYHQIAAHLDISHSAVEARLHRARQRMRDELAALQGTEVRA